MARLVQLLLWIVWGGSFGLGLFCLAMFAEGVWRDARPGDAQIQFRLTSPTEWVSAPFRVWGDSTYDLLLASVNHHPQPVGQILMASFQVQVIDPRGNAILNQEFRAGSVHHQVPDNYTSTKLATLLLSDWPLRPWILRVRVTEPDPAFVTGRTELKIYQRRYDSGMGGLMNYAMIFPAAGFLVIALVLSLPLSKAGTKTPAIMTGIAALSVLLLLA